ncbi:MAG: prephenate dehydrogenase, partial [Vagococcus salmoninarum]
LKAKEQRDSLPKRKAGALASFNDLLVEVPDYAGQITTILAEADLSLTNLKIIENREDIYGTLQLTFKYAGDVMIAKEHLETIGGYRCHEK